MADRAAETAAGGRRGDNRSRAAPHLPGTSFPARGPVPRAYIYQPAPSPTQSGPGRREWVLEFEPSRPYEIDPLTGWTGSRDPFHHVQLRFPDRESAIEFAERHGWRYELRDPPVRRFRPKSYADQFRYDLADAIARAGQPWDGGLSIVGGHERSHAGDGSRANGAGSHGRAVGVR